MLRGESPSARAILGETAVVAGRFAPSPTGDLHVGNLRTALVAWLLARGEGREFLVRFEDLDRVAASVEHEHRQLADLAALGLDHDGVVVRQSERFDLYRDAIADLDRAGLVYPCWCTRREIAAEIAASTSAPHGPTPDAPDDVDVPRDVEVPGDVMVPDGAYPGTCRDLSSVARREREAGERPAALRLRSDDAVVEVNDRVHGRRRGRVDDVVLQRGDGVPAYNLAVVVDDHLQGVTQVVRGDDLLSSTPRQVHLQDLLGLATPEYAHVPLVLGPDGERLAKRHGAVTLTDLAREGVDRAEILGRLVRTLGIDVVGPVPDARTILDRFRLAALPREPLIWDASHAREGDRPVGG